MTPRTINHLGFQSILSMLSYKHFLFGVFWPYRPTLYICRECIKPCSLSSHLCQPESFCGGTRNPCPIAGNYFKASNGSRAKHACMVMAESGNVPTTIVASLMVYRTAQITRGGRKKATPSFMENAFPTTRRLLKLPFLDKKRLTASRSTR